MEQKRLFLESDNPYIYLDAYIAPPIKNRKRRALLVIPGGGYSGVCSDREGYPIAEAFIPYGYSAFVLNYYTGKKEPFPIQLIEAAGAIKHIKDKADEYGINADELFVIGFSAGAHLAGCTAILHNHPAIYEHITTEKDYVKPRGAMLIYPVVSPKYHMGSFKNLLCDDAPSEDKLSEVALEMHVDSDSSPVFILHTANDEIVNVKNSLCLAEAYTNAGVPYEMHIYPDAPHGIALANSVTSRGREKWDNPRIAEWVRMSAEWADEFLKK